MNIVLVFLCIFTIFVQNVSLTQHVYGCDGTKLQLSCERDEIISVTAAIYGRRSQLICGYSSNFKEHCFFKHQTLKKFNQICHAESSCTVLVNSQTFGDPCPGVLKYVEVKFECIRGLNWNTMFYPSG